MMDDEHGLMALRAFRHYCPDCDYKLIGEGDPEFAWCTCFDRDAYLLYSDVREQPKRPWLIGVLWHRLVWLFSRRQRETYAEFKRRRQADNGF